jgi:hypothetical protein
MGCTATCGTGLSILAHTDAFFGLCPRGASSSSAPQVTGTASGTDTRITEPAETGTVPGLSPRITGAAPGAFTISSDLSAEVLDPWLPWLAATQFAEPAASVHAKFERQYRLSDAPPLGEGSSGVVRLARRIADDSEFVVKSFRAGSNPADILKEGMAHGSPQENDGGLYFCLGGFPHWVGSLVVRTSGFVFVWVGGHS